jgi:hypothetical protein
MVSLPPPSTMGSIKGLAFREFLRWYAQIEGPGAIVSSITRMSAKERNHFNLANDTFGVLPSVWYPAELVHRFLDRISHGVPRTDLERMARAAAVPVMRRMIYGIYEYAFSRLVSPSRWVALRQHIWDLYYDTGVLESEIVDLHTVRTSFHGWNGHHPLACMLTRASNIAIYSAMGLANVTVDLSHCVSEGHHECEVWVRWEDPS